MSIDTLVEQLDGAENVTRWSFTCARDNYDPVRTYQSGRLGRLTRNGEPVAILVCEGGFSVNDVYALDDGLTVELMYVQGWDGRETDGRVGMVLGRFPVNPDGRTRPDGRVIDYGTWMLGPRMMRHLKLTPVAP